MKRAIHGIILIVVVLLFFLGIMNNVSVAEVTSLKIEISDVVSFRDALQIKRLLAPWADPEDITFHTPVGKNGKERLFTTVVEIKPRSGVSKYSETHTFDVYNITRQLRDSRYRGRHGLGQVRLLKTEAEIRGDMFTHPGFSRGGIRDIPAWARWRPQTSEIHHALRAGRSGQNFVFKASPEFDQLRHDVVNSNNNEVEIQGEITGFDGPYPIMRVRRYKVGFRTNRQPAPEKSQPMNGEKPTEEQKPKYDYIEFNQPDR